MEEVDAPLSIDSPSAKAVEAGLKAFREMGGKNYLQFATQTVLRTEAHQHTICLITARLNADAFGTKTLKLHLVKTRNGRDRLAHVCCQDSGGPMVFSSRENQCESLPASKAALGMRLPVFSINNQSNTAVCRLPTAEQSRSERRVLERRHKQHAGRKS